MVHESGLAVGLEAAETVGEEEGPGVALEGEELNVGGGAAFREKAFAEGDELGSFVWLLIEEMSGERGERDGLGVSHGLSFRVGP